MKKCVNPSKISAIMAIFVAACAQNSDKNTIVSSDAYRSELCWINQDGSLEALLVLAQEERTAVPYLISNVCTVDENYRSYGEEVLHNLNAIRLVDSYGRLQRTLPTLSISNTTISDQPMPTLDSKIFYFVAKAHKIPDEHLSIYTPIDIIKLTDIGISFGTFLQLPIEKRQNISSGKL